MQFLVMRKTLYARPPGILARFHSGAALAPTLHHALHDLVGDVLHPFAFCIGDDQGHFVSFMINLYI
jgi:hypothetical protein